MVESLVTLVDAAKQLGDNQHLQTLLVAGDDTIIHEQRSVIDQYWETIHPFHMGMTK